MEKSVLLFTGMTVALLAESCQNDWMVEGETEASVKDSFSVG
jgi:hypothetical protein